MSTTDTERSKPDHSAGHVEIVVSFPLAGKGPYRADVDSTTTAKVVLAKAMAHFGVVDDDTATYHLTHKGDKVSESTTMGELARKERTIKLTLAKELIQG